MISAKKIPYTFGKSKELRCLEHKDKQATYVLNIGKTRMYVCSECFKKLQVTIRDLQVD